MNKIKIFDIYGQYTGTDHFYVYSPETNSETWKTRIDDLRTYLSNDVISCYMTWCMSDYGWWLSKAIYSPSRGGHLMFSICIGDNRPQDGHQAIDLLDNLADYFSSSENWNDPNAYDKIRELENSFDTVPCQAVDFAEPRIPINAAYHSYRSTDELATMLTYIHQKGYEGFSRVFFVSEDQAEGMMPNLENLQIIPVKKSFTIILPEDGSCSCDKEELFEGDFATLTYQKKGMNPKQVTITGGKSSTYCLVAGQKMIIRSIKDVNICLTRTISITCSDNSGHTYEEFDLWSPSDEVDIDNSQHTITFKENFHDTFKLKISTKDNSFEQLMENVTPLRIDGSTLDFIVTPSAYSVVFIMDGERFESTNTLNPVEAQNGRWAVYAPEIREKTIEFTVPASLKGKRTKNSGKASDEDTMQKVLEWLKKYWYVLLLGLVLLYAVWGTARVIAKKPWPIPFRKEKPVQPTITRQQLIEDMSKNDRWQRDQIPQDLRGLLYDNIYSGNVAAFFTEVGDGKQVRDTLFSYGKAKINGNWTSMINDLQFIIIKEGSTTERTDIKSQIREICNENKCVALDIIAQATATMRSGIADRKSQEIAKKRSDDVWYMKKNDVWQKNDLQTEEFLTLYDKIVSGDMDYLLTIARRIDEQPRDSTNGYWISICRELTQMEGNNDKLDEAKSELLRICGDGNQITLSAIRKSFHLINNPATPTPTPKPTPTPTPTPTTPNPKRPSSH